PRFWWRGERLREPGRWRYHPVGFQLLGFGGESFVFRQSGLKTATTNVVIPIPAMTAALGVWPTIRVTRRIRKARRKRAGFCEKGGYALRASPERCPEGGTPVPPQAKPASTLPPPL